MKILNKFLLISVIMLSMSFCSAQEQKIINLATITTNFNVAKFYRQKLEITNETLAKDPKKMDKGEAFKLLENQFIVKDPRWCERHAPTHEDLKYYRKLEIA